MLYIHATIVSVETPWIIPNSPEKLKFTYQFVVLEWPPVAIVLRKDRDPHGILLPITAKCGRDQFELKNKSNLGPG